MTWGAELERLFLFNELGLEHAIVPKYQDDERGFGYVLKGENELVDKVFGGPYMVDNSLSKEMDLYRKSNRWGGLLAKKMGLKEVSLSRNGHSNQAMVHDIARYLQDDSRRKNLDYAVVQLTFPNRSIVPSASKKILSSMYPNFREWEYADWYFEGGAYVNKVYSINGLWLSVGAGQSRSKHKIREEGGYMRQFFNSLTKCSDEYYDALTWHAMWSIYGLFANYNIPMKIFFISDISDTGYQDSIPCNAVLDNNLYIEWGSEEWDKMRITFPGFVGKFGCMEYRDNEGHALSVYGTHLGIEGHKIWADTIFEYIDCK